MKVAVFSTQHYEKPYLIRENQSAGHQLTYFTENLNASTVHMAKGFDAVSCFVLDDLSAPVIDSLGDAGIKLIACRSAGYDHVDLIGASSRAITVVTVPVYSPTAVAEFAVLLLLNLARKFVLSLKQFQTANFSLDNLLGIGLHNKTVGIIGTGHIGLAFAKIMRGFGCKILGFDPYTNPDCIALGVQYVALDELLKDSDLVSIHCLLNKETKYLINDQTILQMKPSSLLINTARGPVVDTKAVLQALDEERLAGYGADVYEKERGLFFIDHHAKPIEDPLFSRLANHPKVILTAHQAFFTDEAVTNISRITIENITAFEKGKTQNEVNYSI